MKKLLILLPVLLASALALAAAPRCGAGEYYRVSKGACVSKADDPWYKARPVAKAQPAAKEAAKDKVVVCTTEACVADQEARMTAE